MKASRQPLHGDELSTIWPSLFIPPSTTDMPHQTASAKTTRTGLQPAHGSAPHATHPSCLSPQKEEVRPSNWTPSANSLLTRKLEHGVH